MKRALFFVLLFITVTGYGQVNSINLEDCYRLARENFPRLPDTKRQKEISDLRMQNLGTSWNPQLNLNGQATYQSEVTKVNIPLPGVSIPSPSKDQYKVYLDVKQTIYDGGASEASKSVEKSSLAADLQNLEVELYGINDKVNQLYFNILLMKENEEIIRLKQAVLDERIKVLESGFKNGMVTSRDLELLKAERLLTDQQISEIYSERLALLGTLGILTNQSLNENTTLVEPALQVKSNAISRPELKYFDLLGNKLDQSSQLLQKTRSPKVFGFGQAGYGKPGLNMLKNTFDPYYVVGLGVSWNLVDWNQTGRSRKILEVQKEMIGSQKAIFDQNLSIALFKANEAIRKVDQLLKIDGDLVALRAKIAKNSASSLENGAITSADYIVDLNAATQASINQKSHKVQLLYAITNYNTLAGKP
ncbi:MAG TPA: TolC family protein [Prolixibacteraceae bacterium]